MLKNISPLELPAYRFYYLVVAFVKEINEYEDEAFEQSISELDKFERPWQTTKVENKPQSKSTVREDSADDKAYTPSWWRGDDANAKIAQTMMVTLPKQIGK